MEGGAYNLCQGDRCTSSYVGSCCVKDLSDAVVIMLISSVYCMLVQGYVWLPTGLLLVLYCITLHGGVQKRSDDLVGR